MAGFSSSLDSLGLSFGTDKSSWGHDYLRHYEEYFKRHRYRNIKLLEVGLAGGASIRVWEEYFQKGTIIGADINPEARQFARPRVSIEIVDQSDADQLAQLGLKHGPFDIIIDDGSHMWEHQITTLRILFPFLSADGIYIIEDLQTNYGSMRNNFRGVSTMSCVEYLKQLVDLRVADRQIDISREEDAFLRAYGRRIKSISFFKESCVIQNDNAPAGDAPLIADDRDVGSSLLNFMAHIGSYGDRQSESNFIRGRPRQNIQGFTISSSGPLKIELTYRARYQNGTWTDWVRDGEFVGTRGRGETLSGFSVRLTGQCEEHYHIKIAGAFEGREADVVVENGEDCVTLSSPAKLNGLQIVLIPK